MVKSATANDTVPALIHEDGELSYLSLNRRSGQLAGALAARVEPGQLLAFFPEGRVEDLLLLHAAPRAGIALFPLDQRMPAERMRRLLADSGAEWVLTPAGDTVRLAGAAARQLSIESLSARAPTPAPDRSPGEHAPRLLIATSGSSGEPKAVMLSGANLAASVAMVNQRLTLAPRDRWLCCLPLFHIGGLSIPLRCAAAGATLALHQGFDPERVLTDLDRWRITHLSLVPTQLHRLLEQGGHRAPPKSLRAAVIGGAPLSTELGLRAREAGWPLYPSYGMSETASQIATSGPIGAQWREGEVGPPLAGFEVRSDHRGGLSFRGPAVMLGYANPARSPGDGLDDGWFRGGDRGRFTSGGGLTIDGRLDRLIVSGGEKIDPGEVERRLLGHPLIDEVAVVAVADPEWGERMVALFAGVVGKSALARWCREHFAGPWRPKRLLATSALPRTAAGKIDYPACREIVEARVNVRGK